MDESLNLEIVAILSAKDRERREEREPITEPIGLGKNMSRLILVEWTSLILGKTYRETYEYVNPVDSPAWGAIKNIKREVF